MILICEKCKIQYNSSHKKRRFCSHSCYAQSITGIKLSLETCKKLSDLRRGEKHYLFGKHQSQETIEKIKIARSKQVFTEEHKKKMRENASRFWLGKKRPEVAESTRRANKGNSYNKGRKLAEYVKENLRIKNSGSNNPRWIADRDKLKKDPDRRNTASFEWKKNIYARDGFKCKIGNEDCKGRIEAHHILRWADYPELRYDLNNGITLCKHHHPRKKVVEMEMSPYFKSLINQKHGRHQ